LIEILEEFIEERRSARRSSTGTKQPWYAVYFLLFLFGITGQISDQAMCKLRRFVKKAFKHPFVSFSCKQINVLFVGLF
jgi:hypothetical protein